MRKVQILLFFFLLLLCTPASGKDILKIGYFYLEPFIMEEEGAPDPIGVSVDYWEKLVAPAMGVQIEWVGPLPITRMYYYLETGDIDTIFIVVKNPDREKKYLFSSRPFFKMHACLWVLKESPLVSIRDIKQLNGWRIGFVEGSQINPFLKSDNVRIENAQGMEYKLINFSKLFAKRLDAIYDHNEYTLAYEALRLGFRDKLRYVPIPAEPNYNFAAFTKNDRGRRFLKIYDSVNNALPSDAVEKIIKEYTEK